VGRSEHCPFCDQEIPPDKLEEISGRITAREQARVSEALVRIQEQHVRERAESAAKARAQLEDERKAADARVAKLTVDAEAREAAARAEGKKAAHEEARVKLESAETARGAAEAALLAKTAEVAKVNADVVALKAEATKQIDRAKADATAAITKVKEEAASRETLIRAEAVRSVEKALNDKLAAAELAKTEAEHGKAEALQSLSTVRADAAKAITDMKEAHAHEINVQREALEKDKTSSVNAERTKNLETKMRLEEKLQDLTRQLQKKTADELGEGAELDLFEVLKAAFDGDKLRRVQKGTAGADIVHEIVHNGKVCGKIVYDSKNRSAWRNDYAAKLREDQIAERADHAILSTNKFPAGERQLHVQDSVIVACPARVVVLAALLRDHVVNNHELRISGEARDEKSAALYTFITSERCRQLLDSTEGLISKLEQIDVDEEKAHRTVWKKRGELLRSVLKVNGDFRFEIGRIVGTASTP
jgi:hypothetical protein